ncbi:TPA: helix-turn-helix domain-containing protein [Klebsiella quasipneumoniae subsp. quasipneumoniae]|nr:helix-turn-helix domain-containing protein [Klebsiella quasipneumoniae subsp. quasipneumoniae]
MMPQDRHSADIIAVLRKRGTSLAALTRQAGLASSWLTNALNRRWPKGEWMITEALGVVQSKSSLRIITSQIRNGGSRFPFPKSKNPAIGWVL